MKLKKRFIILIVFFFWPWGINMAMAVDPSMEDYTHYPISMTQAVKPNILIILDNSASMNYMAYGYHEDGDYHPDDFGAIALGIAKGGSANTLVDNDASFTEKVAVGDVLHNIDDGSTGTITAITNDTTIQISAGMSGGTNDANDRYWIEHALLKNPSQVSEGYYGYSVPTARYTYSSNVFWRDDVSGQWSGPVLNWATMRRVDVVRKVLLEGLATSMTGVGAGHKPCFQYQERPKTLARDRIEG